MIYAGVPSFSALGLEDGHVPTFWLLLCTIGVLESRIGGSSESLRCSRPAAQFESFLPKTSFNSIIDVYRYMYIA